MTLSPIRVLIVHSSPLVVRVLERILESSREISVVGSARHGREALEMWRRLSPNVILSAPSLPIVDGAALTREVMAHSPTAILALPSSPTEPLLEEMLAAGAIDYFVPLSIYIGDAVENRELLTKIKRLSRVPLVSRRRSEEGVPIVPTPDKTTNSTPSASSPVSAPASNSAPSTPSRTPKIIGIGASTGGPPVLATILGALPRQFSLPIVCVQHISKGFLAEMIEWLDGNCKLDVKVAQNGEFVQAGSVYFAPEDAHLEVAPSGRLSFSNAAPFMGHRPSINTLFHSLARSYGAQTCAMLLTGMGSDGAQGLKAILDAGGLTWAQSQESCTVFGMPKEAIQLGATRAVLSPTEIASRLNALR